MKSLFILLLSLVSVQAHAVLPVISPTERSPEWLNELVGLGIADYTDYQIGNEWGKRPVTADDLKSKGPAYTRSAVATARFGGGTAFYLGKINGHHLMATNHHVMPNGRACSSRTAQFPILGKSFPCLKFYGEWNAIDLALFSIKVESADDEALLAKFGRSFNFRTTLQPGQELLTIGFGTFRNPSRKLVANDDSDCRVFSERNDFRFIADPDQINPADYKTWSFAIGCDVSHGDSGSSIVDRATGDVVGIIWTAATQKPERIRSSSYLDGILRSPHADTWTWLSYAVPAPKIKDYLVEFLGRSQHSDQDVEQTLRAFLE